MVASAGYAALATFSEDSNGAAAVVEQIKNDGGTAVAVQADVSVPDAVLRIFEAAQALGPVTAVVNNAGIIGNLVDVAPETIKRVLEVNVVGTLFMCQEAMRRMSLLSGGKGGSILNISSPPRPARLAPGCTTRQQKAP